jgi:hypothetical protein
MALAQVVYQISTDADFASQLRSNPERTLEKRGWSLSKEEIAFLVSALTRKADGQEKRPIDKPDARWFWF